MQTEIEKARAVEIEPAKLVGTVSESKKLASDAIKNGLERARKHHSWISGVKLIVKNNPTRKHGMGTYYIKEKTIVIYNNAHAYNFELIDTALHELAHHIHHELVNEGLFEYKSAHDKTWKQLCRFLGCKPKATC